ncbi:MAG: TlpA disulfide reductase family protein [Pyrinomonadaceae bacterium]
MAHLLKVLVLIVSASAAALGQMAAPVSKMIYRDYEGTLISNNEFVDIRMANFHYKDATIVNTLADGSTEFRLQKIPQEGMAAPAFTLKTVDGKTLSLDALKGKVVVLNFWFIGCAICRAHKPKLNELKARFGEKDDVVFLAMSPDPKSDVKDFVKKERFDYLQAPDAQPSMKPFHFSGYPKNIVINKRGEIVYWRSTITAWDKFESVIRGELAID